LQQLLGAHPLELPFASQQATGLLAQSVLASHVFHGGLLARGRALWPAIK
jgi:hypothetical protein